MSAAEPASPIACRMDALSPQQRARRDEVVARIRATLVGASETEDGVAFRWPGSADVCALVGEFIALESLCCPFIHFTLEVAAERGPVSLRLGGREGVKDFLRATFLVAAEGHSPA